MTIVTTCPAPVNELERSAQIKFGERIAALYEAEGLDPASYPPYKSLLEHLERVRQMSFHDDPADSLCLVEFTS